MVFTLKSLTHPDSIMVYFKHKGKVCLPTLGLVPGCIATFNSFSPNISKSSNVYFTNSASSSITVNSLDDIEAFKEEKANESLMPSLQSIITLDMLKLPTSYISHLGQALISGGLTRRVVCLRVRVVSVQRLSLQYKCHGCQYVILNGQCMVACLQKRPYLLAEGR